MTRQEHEKILSAPPGILTNVEHYHPEFIHDQSRLVGWMDSISFPETEGDIRDQVAAMGLACCLKASPARPAALEYFDHHSVELLGRRKDVFENYQMGHEVPSGPPWAVYAEYHTEDADSARRAAGDVGDAVARLGGDRGLMWVEAGQDAMANFKQIKHLLPEVVNGLVAERQKAEPGIRKLGTDFAVPDERFAEMMALYQRDLDAGGFEHLVFGHLGDCNLHVNIIPRSLAEYEAGRQVYHGWARAAVRMGGTVSAEHGIGKLKRALLREMFAPQAIEEMRQLKARFDPGFLLNPGNLFDAP